MGRVLVVMVVTYDAEGGQWRLWLPHTWGPCGGLAGVENNWGEDGESLFVFLGWHVRNEGKESLFDGVLFFFDGGT